ncbi:MAG: D-tyrosyl-tRNA(Tyr) deacylase [Ruminococcaceae bacterium]|nr:D-tyrosyl-tRNA(Tyr) deacylase [Oscillospiraceae bacterium]
MTVVIQRVKSAAVKAEGELVGQIGKGLLLLLGVFENDSEKDAEVLAAKLSKLRIFSDENGKMNRSVNDEKGGVLVVSNFTLCANYKHGNRPDYIRAEKPQRANMLYEYFSQELRKLIEGGVANGSFGADMEISAVLDGPVTIVMDSRVLTGEV